LKLSKIFKIQAQLQTINNQILFRVVFFIYTYSHSQYLPVTIEHIENPRILLSYGRLAPYPERHQELRKVQTPIPVNIKQAEQFIQNLSAGIIRQPLWKQQAVVGLELRRRDQASRTLDEKVSVPPDHLLIREASVVQQELDVVLGQVL